jgi:hypothetical protein
MNPQTNGDGYSSCFARAHESIIRGFRGAFADTVDDPVGLAVLAGPQAPVAAVHGVP